MEVARMGAAGDGMGVGAGLRDPKFLCRIFTVDLLHKWVTNLCQCIC